MLGDLQLYPVTQNSAPDVCPGLFPASSVVLFFLLTCSCIGPWLVPGLWFLPTRCCPDLACPFLHSCLSYWYRLVWHLLTLVPVLFLVVTSIFCHLQPCEDSAQEFQRHQWHHQPQALIPLLYPCTLCPTTQGRLDCSSRKDLIISGSPSRYATLPHTENTQLVSLLWKISSDTDKKKAFYMGCTSEFGGTVT